ncbi:MAG: HD domain-containing protein [Candidatus Bathyarchaeota archaeon]|nr:MAG: HD domain-containing protein [Candidatus Bathyarchaeota archaeon]
MYLDENLQRLNKAYNSKGLSFKKDGDYIRIFEKKPYLFNEFETLKALLKNNFDLKFNPNLIWHFDNSGIEKLSNKKLKWQPFKDVGTLKKELNGHIEKIQEEEMKGSITKFFENNPCFFDAPASTGYHHAYVGGLLEHSVQTADLALVLANNLHEDININFDLVIAGSILHDIGKMNCYEYLGGNIGITRMYNLQDHIINGIKLASLNINSTKLDDLLHIIASHHNLKDWGSPIQPQSNEAWIIHNIENLSAKIMG